LQQHRAALEALDAHIVAISSDAAEDARGTVEALGLGFRVLSGLDAEDSAAQVGCYTGTHNDNAHVQPTSFVLDRAGRIVHALYSSGKLGRLTGNDAVTLAKDLQQPAGV